MPELKYNGQSRQDEFVCRVLEDREFSFFVELGSWHPIHWNNSYVLESELGWSGIMLELDEAKFKDVYLKERPKSAHVFGDAQQHDFRELLVSCDAPKDIGYFQMDIDPPEQTLNVLKHLDGGVMDEYRFAVVTYEHDCYAGGVTCRLESRRIFKERGYYLVFGDINDGDPNRVYEDWYVHPDLVDMEYIARLQRLNKRYYYSCHLEGVESSIDCSKIVYPIR